MTQGRDARQVVEMAPFLWQHSEPCVANRGGNEPLTVTLLALGCTVNGATVTSGIVPVIPHDLCPASAPSREPPCRAERALARRAVPPTADADARWTMAASCEDARQSQDPEKSSGRDAHLEPVTMPALLLLLLLRVFEPDRPRCSCSGTSLALALEEGFAACGAPAG